MDITVLTNAGFIGLTTIGIVNVVTMFIPNIDSRIKFIISVVSAFALSFVPEEIGIVVFDKMKVALEVAFMASGAYKLATKAGGLEVEK